ncbi:MAG TPA: Maf family protein [Thermoanaerobaculia bacterium]|nr:Maf family protein [Thermoanaerobaculia bacterium]
MRRDRTACPGVVLASASPRRRELLTSIGLRFEVRAVAVDESVRLGESPEEHVLRLALEKARASGEPGELVLGADTVVVLDGEILGKPRDREDARRMLGLLEGREHRVLTGVALREVASERSAVAVAASDVRLRPLDAEEIAWYVTTGEPSDKAGAYALQGVGGLFVDSIRGSSSNVIGLPLGVVYELFPELGYDLRDFRCEAPIDPAPLRTLDTLPPS